MEYNVQNILYFIFIYRLISTTNMKIEISNLIEIAGSENISLHGVRGFNRLAVLLDIQKLLIIVFLLLFT